MCCIFASIVPFVLGVPVGVFRVPPFVPSHRPIGVPPFPLYQSSFDPRRHFGSNGANWPIEFLENLKGNIKLPFFDFFYENFHFFLQFDLFNF
jgi:hypothetical protein